MGWGGEPLPSGEPWGREGDGWEARDERGEERRKYISFTPRSEPKASAGGEGSGVGWENESPYLLYGGPKDGSLGSWGGMGTDKDFHSPILAVTIVTQQINS